MRRSFPRLLATTPQDSVSGQRLKSPSNRPFGVKHFQTIHPHSVDVARGLVLLFGIGTPAPPSWD